MPGTSEAHEKPQQPAPLPAGTVTFLFTDIEGSAQRWERHRDAMKAAVARHEQLLTAAMQQHGGYVFKTVGDAFCAAFATAPDAVAAAVDAQRALAEEDFSAVDGLYVRIGLHTGYAEERNADYFGPAVNRVARLMSIGHGGQILLSGVTHELAQSDLPEGTKLVDLGSHRLKDLTEPEQVWQLSIEGLPAAFAPLRSLDALPNNLPIQRTRFVGREHTVAEVKELVNRDRLVTLVGSGGVGKTRIAMQVGADLLDHYPDGVWFVDFAPITDPELVSSVIAQVLGMSQQEGKRVDESIPPWLKRKKLLLILDNCEHVLEPVATIAAAIIGTAPDVRIMNTSRQMLDVSGEEVFRVPSLDVPHTVADLTPAGVEQFGAVALFVDRARSIDKSFTVTDNTAPIVADICRRLDGIPLAIELAAARVKVLSISNLAQRLNERFKILTGGSRDVLPRQKTLTALIDWSYDLLKPQEQLLFTRLSIFAGSFSLDAAVKVCGREGLDEIEVLDLLSSLADKSLVVSDTAANQERYHLLESTRAYALDKLAAAGEREQLARRHADYYHDLAESADEQFATGSTLAWVADVERDLDNYRAALEWTITQHNDEVVGGAIVGYLERLWNIGGLAVEGRYWIGLALQRVSEPEHPRVAATLWRGLANLSFGKATVEAAEHAVVLYESVGDALGVNRAKQSIADAVYRMGHLHEADDINNRVLESFRELGDKRGVATGLNQQAMLAWLRGDSLRARDGFAQAIASFRALGDQHAIQAPLGNLAELEFQEGRPDEAVRLANETLEIDQQGKNSRALGIDYVNLAAYRIALGDLDGSRESARRGLRIARERQESILAAIALQHLSLIAALSDQGKSAARLLGYVDVQYKAIDYQREPTEQWGYDRLMAALREKLSDAEIKGLGAEGAAWSEDQAVEQALKV